jgi:hypothetical protein
VEGSLQPGGFGKWFGKSMHDIDGLGNDLGNASRKRFFFSEMISLIAFDFEFLSQTPNTYS